MTENEIALTSVASLKYVGTNLQFSFSGKQNLQQFF